MRQRYNRKRATRKKIREDKAKKRGERERKETRKTLHPNDYVYASYPRVIVGRKLKPEEANKEEESE